MGELDKMLHAFAAMVSTKNCMTWRDIPKHPELKGEVRYYYCEERLYLFQTLYGSMYFAYGDSPYDAYCNWNKNREHFVGCVR